MDALKDAAYQIVDIKTGERTRKAPVPFTTSTLQQEASKQLNFSTQKTMRLAQQLYEGVDIQGLGTVGLITYLRTDSIRISEEADSNARNFIAENYGQEYVAAAPKTAESGKKIQDAHEATVRHILISCRSRSKSPSAETSSVCISLFGIALLPAV